MSTIPGAPTNPMQAMMLGLRQFVISSWPWRSLGYLACGAVVVLPVLALIKWLSGIGTMPAWVLGGVTILVVDLLLAVPLAKVERLRLRVVDTEPAVDPHAPLPSSNIWRRLSVRLAESATWREFGYAVVMTVVFSFVDFVVVILALIVLCLPATPLLQFILDIDALVSVGTPVTGPVGIALVVVAGLALLPLTACLVGLVAAAQAAFARLLLAPRDVQLTARVQELTWSRARLVDAFEAERTRIERDLHDGAQQRLVMLTITLGMAEWELARAQAGGAGPGLVAKARHDTERVLAEIRELIRGIRPQVLIDRGIAAAVSEMANRCPIPVAVDVTLSRRPSPAAEAVAYFAVSEALTNIVKHSHAKQVQVAGGVEGDRLVLTVVDDGVGGADPARGTGLQGLADRVSVVGGSMLVTSPPGGPTELLVELPCPALRCE